MAEQDPTSHDYLAVVSEWESITHSGGRVGNMYPLLNLATGEVVTDPQDSFANAGAIFLTNRGALETWDFAVVRPKENERYRNEKERDCFYIPARQPYRVDNPTQAANVAVVLEHPSFDLATTSRQILNPRHNVTPIFFVQKNQSFIGPLIRDITHLTPMDDVQRIDWRPEREDGIVHEFTRAELLLQGIRLVHYSHPEPTLNRVLSVPFLLAVGAVRKATSGTPRDALSDTALVEWYLHRCPTVEVPSLVLANLKAAFRAAPGDDPAITTARLSKIEQQMATHTAFHEQREGAARRYVDSEPGQLRVAELIEQAVTKKAAEVRAEVDKRDRELAQRRDDLDTRFDEAKEDHRRRLAALELQREAAERKVNELNRASAQLQQQLSADVQSLADRMQEQLPLFAALTGARRESTPAAPAAGGVAPLIGKPPPREFRPIAPSATLRPVADEGKLVTDLHTDLARRGLHFARDFVANVYTCLKAEPLNLIIGPPGYGKSMLVAALARALGHADALLRIAVRRSWSEDRYLLGFYDSFHGRYDPGAAGLVTRMLQAAADWRQAKEGIYIVLLDEFNLAAPEYYFSQLLQALPSDDPVREVALYDEGSAPGDGFPGRVPLGPNLRFWGTINYDETTERLSPRTLDRTGMIFLGDADVKQTLEEEPAPMAGVAASDLFGKFLRGANECPEDRWEIVSQVIDCLRSSDASLGPRVELSPRSRRAIKRYLANSVNVLPARAAVDFVVQQRILPGIRGRGEELAARAHRLVEVLSRENLPRAAAHVEEALRRSQQQFGELDFLSY